MEGIIRDITQIYEVLIHTEDRLRDIICGPPPGLTGMELAEWDIAEEDRVYGQVEELGFTVTEFNDFFNGDLASKLYDPKKDRVLGPCMAVSFPKVELMAKICGVPLRVLVGKDQDSACMREVLIHSLAEQL